MTDVAELKAATAREVDQVTSLLVRTSDWMADNPELGLQEYQAAAKLTEMLEEFGAAVERGIAGLPTAFRATLPGGNPDGPTIAIIAEYDALPDVGHGCGHNIIANAAIGAGIALARLGQRGEIPGRVIVLGTPAEESAVPNAGGKTMAMTAIDLITNPDVLAAAKREHKAATRPIREGLAKIQSANAG